jgi:hypothetical protein
VAQAVEHLLCECKALSSNPSLTKKKKKKKKDKENLLAQEFAPRSLQWGGEMTQALYAHMNNKIKKKKEVYNGRAGLMASSGPTVTCHRLLELTKLTCLHASQENRSLRECAG